MSAGIRDFEREVKTEGEMAIMDAVRAQPAPPCDDMLGEGIPCRYKQKCGEKKMACEGFGNYLGNIPLKLSKTLEKRTKDQLSYWPSKQMFKLLYNTDVEDALPLVLYLRAVYPERNIPEEVINAAPMKYRKPPVKWGRI